jgi:peptidoglycan/xylan/chitin deacetylase (PgdA/CDA1 family)
MSTTPTNVVPDPTLNTVDPNNSTEPNSWYPVTWGTNTTKFSYLKTGQDDTNSIEAQITSYTSGASEWLFDAQPVTADTQYKFSDYYKSNISSEVEIAFNMSDGSTLYEQLALPGASTSWKQLSTVFNAPLGAQSFQVYQFIQKVGYVTTDDYSVTPYTPSGFNRPLVTLTFDDGWQSTFTNGIPLLQKYGFTSTQFIITDEVNEPDYDTVANLNAMAAEGNEIASHTVTHDDMTQETSSQLKTELSNSKTQLQKWLPGVPITDFAYPFGLYNATDQTATAEYYTAARGVEPGLNSKDEFNRYDLKVENVFTTTTAAQVADWVKQAQATNTWLIIVYHSVSATPTDSNNVTPTDLDNQLAAIKASGVTVENMNTALAEVMSQL